MSETVVIKIGKSKLSDAQALVLRDAVGDKLKSLDDPKVQKDLGTIVEPMRERLTEVQKMLSGTSA